MGLKDFFKGFKEGQKEFGETISAIVNFMLLTIVYIIGVGLTSIFAKLFRKKFINLKKGNKNSYWVDLNLGKKPILDYYKQF